MVVIEVLLEKRLDVNAETKRGEILLLSTLYEVRLD